MRLNTGFRALVATDARIQIENEYALTFVKALLDIFIQNPMTYGRAAQVRKRFLHCSPTQLSEPAQHLEKISPTQLCQLQVIHCGASRCSNAGRKRVREIVAS
jgi:hypothetical protein